MMVRRIGVATLTMVTLVVVAPSARAQPGSTRGDVAWSQARFGPSHLGVNPFETILSPTTVGGLHQLWATHVGGDVGLSAPAVVDGVVYIGSWDRRIYAIEADTGGILWSTLTDEIHEDAPAVANGIVYSHSNAGTLYAMDATTGDVLWTADPGHAVSSPTVSGNHVLVLGYGELDAYDGQTGELIWSAGPIDLAVNAPTVARGRILVVDEGGFVTAVNPRNGTIVWQRRIKDESFQLSTPAVANDVLYVGAAGSNTVYAINAENGRVVWQTELDSLMDSSPAVANGVVYIGGYAGIYALDARSGVVLWTHPGPFVVGLGVSEANGVVYAVADVLYALDASTGDTLWTGSVGTQTTKGPSSPAVVNGTVFVGCGAKVFAFGL
jgi:outer membrane protein assembly factor BamB